MRAKTVFGGLLGAALLAGGGILAVSGQSVVPPLETAPSAAPTLAAPTDAAPTDEPEVVVTPPPPADRAAVVRDLGLLLADPEYDTQGQLAVVVLDEWGREVVASSGATPLLPASTMKLVTAAAVLGTHDPLAPIGTPVLLDGTLSSRGTLVGDVVLVAAGDPSLTTEAYRTFVFPARPSSAVTQLADLLLHLGVTSITGDVVVDPGAYADERVAPGWREEYLLEFDARNITGMTVDAGLDVTVDAPREAWDEVRQDPILLDELLEIRQSRDPLVLAGAHLHRAVEDSPLFISGDPVVGEASPIATQVAELQSPPVVDLLAWMVKQSDNHVADTLLRRVGALRSPRSSWASSSSAAADVLAELGVELAETTAIVDGSGLSRDNRISARELAELDRAMAASEHAEVWSAIQSVAGVDGTMRRRLAGTIADGRFLGKTGTLDDVRSLVGTVQGPDGTRYHLAVVANGGEVWRSVTLADQLILRLTRSLWCGVEDPPLDVALACVPAPAPSES